MVLATWEALVTPAAAALAAVRPTDADLLSVELSEVQERIARCSQMAKALNLRGPSVFIEGARGNLRNAAAELHWAISHGSGPCPVSRLREHGVALRKSTTGRGLAVRQRVLVGGRVEDAPDADGREGAPVPNLVIDLLGDEAAVRAARRPLFAALLSNALANHAWLHRGSRTIWSEGGGAARVAAAIVAGGRHFPDLSHADLGGLVDQEVASALARSDWVRLASPKPPGWAATPGS